MQEAFPFWPLKFGSSEILIHNTLVDNGLKILYIGAANMNEVVNHAGKIAKYGDVIVPSPNCASVDEFRNFEHKEMVFQELAFLSSYCYDASYST
ncbi:hypothetical protein Ddye_002637 [Dipteronia dyeriana]|uniref:Uncharacterized protein n=1 Tax=Dipteronia dyeriana TaxID=168575 RepID=A0AAE0CV66_9ROSI|nr:hypothetical protein Ddye_002637 [Dipteronia dyeriana]